MTQVRIDVADLARELDAALARLDAGDEVLLERSGRVVACLARGPAEAADKGPGKGTLGAFIAARRKEPPWPPGELDAFERDLETAREWLNRPPQEREWD